MAKKAVNLILLDLREKHNLKQKDVANILGVSQQTYSNYERGKREIPICYLKTLAEFYHTSLDYMMNTSVDLSGTMNSASIYVDDITVAELLYDLDQLHRPQRRELVRYLEYLKQINP